jgi:hypothetical protein
MIVFIILAIIIFIIGYTLFYNINEGLNNQTPSPHIIPIPQFIKDVNKCDYPLLFQGLLSSGANEEGLNASFSNTKYICDKSNPQNITNQTEICSIIADLSNSYYNVVEYNRNPGYAINQGSCPIAVYDPNSKGLNQSSVCNLYGYVKQGEKVEASMRKSGEIPPNEPPIFDKIISTLKSKCNSSNPNACIIGNAIVGNLPSYCSISTTPITNKSSITTSTPSPTPSRADIVNISGSVSSIGNAGF